MDLFESSPRYAAHVEELQFVFNTFNIERLVSIFPNARAVTLDPSSTATLPFVTLLRQV
jgi:hypothetical protein